MTQEKVDNQLETDERTGGIDSFLRWLLEQNNITFDAPWPEGDDRTFVKANELHKRYTEYCTENKIQPDEILKSKGFGMKLSRNFKFITTARKSDPDRTRGRYFPSRDAVEENLGRGNPCDRTAPDNLDNLAV